MKLGIVVSFLVGAFVGGLIQLALAVVFENSFRKVYRRTQARLFWLVTLVRGGNYDPAGRDYFRIGKERINCIVLEGTARQPFLADAVSTIVGHRPITLPADLNRRYREVTAEQEKIATRTGHPAFTNGPMVALEGWTRSRTVLNEDALLTLRFRPTDYYTFLATAMSLGDRLSSPGGSITVREKYVRGRSYSEPNCLISTSFGVNLTVVTKDRYTFLARRGTAGISSYGGRFAVPVAESVHPVFDASGPNSIDLYLTVQRGAQEEMNITVARDEIKLFSLVVDTAWYMYGLTGAIYSGVYSRDDLLAVGSVGTKDKWETEELLSVPFNPIDVARFVSYQGGPDQFSPSSLVALVQALIDFHGERVTMGAFKQVFH